MNLWQDILISILTSGTITGIFVAILNKAIENKFDMKLEAYKDKLKAESDKELLQLTKDLELKASERDIKLTKVFQTQAEVISKTYRLLLELQGAYTNLKYDLRPDSRQPNADCFRAKVNECIAYYYPNAIYIPHRTGEKIGNFIQTLNTAKVHLEFAYFDHSLNLTTEQKQESRKEFDALDKSIPDLLGTLKGDFQQILGFPISDKQR
jgi:hypothetical protein